MRYTIGGIALVLVVVFGISWAFEGNDFFIYKVFAPKRAAVERQVFEETKSYNDGMAQELQNMQRQYLTATPEQKQALGSIIAHRTANYDLDHLNDQDLKAFVLSVRSAQIGGAR